MYDASHMGHARYLINILNLFISKYYYKSTLNLCTSNSSCLSMSLLDTPHESLDHSNFRDKK